MRKDTWTVHDDEILANTVLNYVSQGKSQLEAFEACEMKLGRTTTACGFRWNSEVRKHHEKEIKEAKLKGKEQRKNRNKIANVSVVDRPESRMEKLEVFDWDETIKSLTEGYRRLNKAFEEVSRENVLLKEKLAEQPNGEDLKMLLELMNHARKIGLTEAKTS